MDQFGGDLPRIDIDKCIAHKGEICGSEVWFWIAIVLIILVLAAGGYLGYKYYAEDLCFRTGSVKCDDRTK